MPGAKLKNKKKFLVDLRRPILLSMEDFNYLKDAKVASDDGLDYIITLMKFNQVSRNGSMYPKEDSLKSLNESVYVQESIKNRVLFGEMEHPEIKEPEEAPQKGKMPKVAKRFLRVEPTRRAWAILKYWDEGDILKGHVHLVPPLGTSILQPTIKDLGSNYAASVRWFTPHYLEQQDASGNVYLVKKYRMFPVTWDAVTLPGLPGSRLMEDAAYNPKPLGFASGPHSMESSHDIVINHPELELRDMILSEESCPILEDYFQMSMRDCRIMLTRDDRVDIATEDGVHVSVPFNSYILTEIMGGKK
jgi:hypothetical protein